MIILSEGAERERDRDTQTDRDRQIDRQRPLSGERHAKGKCLVTLFKMLVVVVFACSYSL